MRVVRVFLSSKIRLAEENICRASSLDSATLGLKFGRVLLVCCSFPPRDGHRFSSSLSFVSFVIRRKPADLITFFFHPILSWELGLLTSEKALSHLCHPEGAHRYQCAFGSQFDGLEFRTSLCLAMPALRKVRYKEIQSISILCHLNLHCSISDNNENFYFCNQTKLRSTSPPRSKAD